MRSAEQLERWERATDRPLLVLALLFFVVLLVPLVTVPPHEVVVALAVADGVLYLVFAGDYLVRLALAPERWRFVRTHPLDLLLVLVPFLRPLRLVAAAGVVHRRVRRLHLRVAYAVAATAAVLLLGSAAVVLEVERDAPGALITTYPDAVWWSITTTTTVGYGDLYPTTGAGRLVAIGLMVVGIALLGVVTATIAAWFVDRLREQDRAEDEASDLRTEALLGELREELRALRAQLESRG